MYPQQVMKRFEIIILIITASVFPAQLSAEDAAAGEPGFFTAVGVQYEIVPEDYESRDVFFGKAEELLRESVSGGGGADIVVFPEYIGVFYQLIGYNGLIRKHDDFQTALAAVLCSAPGLEVPADIFTAGEAVESWIAGWSELAAGYGVTIIAGSCFVRAEDGGLRNRAHVFGPDGSLVYSQDKVYLTDFETQIVGLSPGRMEDASFFEVEGENLALTICRDAYSRGWEKKHSGAYLWIDIKANGETFDEAQQRSFMRALPSRMAASDVDYGFTVCAVGRYLDLFWEGRSSAIVKKDGYLRLAAAARSPAAGEIVRFSIPRR